MARHGATSRAVCHAAASASSEGAVSAYVAPVDLLDARVPNSASFLGFPRQRARPWAPSWLRGSLEGAYSQAPREPSVGVAPGVGVETGGSAQGVDAYPRASSKMRCMLASTRSRSASNRRY